MKTINFLTSHFIPENTACTNRVLAFIRELEKTYKINLIQENSKVSYSDKIDIYYVNQKKFNGKNYFIRALNEMFYIRQLVQISKKIDYDLVIATSPYMFMIPIVGFGLHGPKILDIRDLVWEYLDDKNRYDKLIKIQLVEDIPFTVTYVGNIGLAQNIRTIIDAAKQLPEVRFFLLGPGVELQDMQVYVEKNQINFQKYIISLSKLINNKCAKIFFYKC